MTDKIRIKDIAERAGVSVGTVDRVLHERPNVSKSAREKVEKAEAYFNDHGKVSTFVGRFIPGIRQLISIPAGLSKMHFGWFLFYTFLGAGIWNAILAVLGYVAHGQADLINKYSHELSVAILVLLGAVVLYYLIRWMIKRVKA